MAEVEVKFSETGASFVFDQIKKVERSVDQVRSKMRSPIGQDLNAEMFGVKAMQQATGALHHLGIEYEKTRAKMKSPLGLGDSQLKSSNFTAKSIRDMNNELDKMSGKVRDTGAHLGFVSRILAAMAIRAVAREVYEMANAFQTLQNKLKTITPPESLRFISKELFDIAQNSKASLESVVTAYSRTTRSVQALGKSQSDVLKFTDNLSKAILVGGSTAVEASNAMIQLSQGMGSGALRGDELRSVLEQLPIVAELIADKLGVPISALRKLGAEGKISTDVIFDAINAGQSKIDKMVASMEITVPQAWQKFKNASIVASEGAQGAMGKLARAIEFVTNNMDMLIKAAESLGMALIVVFGARVISSVIAGIASYIAALKSAKVAQMGLNAATLANPYVAAGVALAALTVAVAPYIAEIKIAGYETVTFGDQVSETFSTLADSLDTSKAQQGIRALTEEINGLDEAIEKTMERAATAPATATAMGASSGFENALSVWIAGVGQSTRERLSLLDEDRITDKAIKEGQDILAEDISLSPGKTSGQKTLEDYTAELEDRVDALRTGGTAAMRVNKKFKKFVAGIDANVRDLMSYDDYDDIRRKLMEEDRLSHPNTGKEKKIIGWKDIMGEAENDEFAATLDEQTIRITKKAEQLLAKLDKSAFQGLSSEEIRQKTEALLDVLRHEDYILESKKQQLELEKEMNKSVDERLKAMLKEEAAIAKSNETKFNDRNALNVNLANELDPEIAVGIEIRKWEEFEKRMANFPDLAEKARKKIRELQDSLALGGLAAEYARDIEAIYGVGGSLSKGFSDTAAEIVVMNRNLRETKQLFADLAASIAQQALSRGIQLMLDTGISAIAGGLGGGGGVSPGLTVAGSGAPTQITMVPGQFASGGYTGDYGVDDVAGLVHGREFVMNSEATASIGKSNLALMNQTGKIPAQPAVEKSASAPVVNVHNYAGVQVDTSVSRGEINIMIDRAIKEKTPAMVATEIRNPNSRTSRSLGKHLDADRRRR